MRFLKKINILIFNFKDIDFNYRKSIYENDNRFRKRYFWLIINKKEFKKQINNEISVENSFSNYIIFTTGNMKNFYNFNSLTINHTKKYLYSIYLYH